MKIGLLAEALDCGALFGDHTSLCQDFLDVSEILLSRRRSASSSFKEPLHRFQTFDYQLVNHGFEFNDSEFLS